MSIKYTITVGLSNYEQSHNDDGFGELNAGYAVKAHAKQLAILCGGYTLTEAFGGYVMDNGMLVTERVAVLSVIDVADTHSTAIYAIARAICLEFKEECVLVERVETDARFVRGK